MGCGCNKVRSYSPEKPLLFGEPDGQPARNVRATVAIMGLRSGSEFWAAGEGLDHLLSAGWVTLL